MKETNEPNPKHPTALANAILFFSVCVLPSFPRVLNSEVKKEIPNSTQEPSRDLVRRHITS